MGEGRSSRPAFSFSGKRANFLQDREFDMKLFAIITSLVWVAASPPPPPPPAPDIAQGEFDGFAGPDLWRAWQRQVRVQALQMASEAYRAAGETGDGAFVRNEGPSIEVSTGYWTEGFNARFSETCPRNRPDQCAWSYRSIRLNGNQADFDGVTLATFDGALLAADLRERNVSPTEFDPARAMFTETAALEAALATHINLVSVSADSCPAVGQWQERLNEVAPIYLSGEAQRQPGEDSANPPPMPPPPYPIHIRHVIEIPVTAFATADVTVRIDDTRNRQLSDLWGIITRGISDCTAAQ
jgi:hypothetical protein